MTLGPIYSCSSRFPKSCLRDDLLPSFSFIQIISLHHTLQYLSDRYCILTRHLVVVRFYNIGTILDIYLVLKEFLVDKNISTRI